MDNEQKFNDFISLSDASKQTGYHQDYLGYLCRIGKLNGFKVGRNWLVTKTELDRFIKTYQNGISEVTDETGHKIPVHVQNIELPSVPVTPKPVAEKIDLSHLKREVVESLENRISLIAEQVSEVETTLKQQKEIFQKSKAPEPRAIIAAVAEVPEFPRQPLHDAFVPNLDLGQSQIEKTEQVKKNFTDLLNADKAKQLLQSFKTQPAGNKKILAAVTAIVILGFVASAAWTSLFRGRAGNEQTVTKIVYQNNLPAVSTTTQNGKTIIVQGGVTNKNITEILQGPKGDNGPKGDTGAAGANGTNGSNGENGINGSSGSNGTTLTYAPISYIQPAAGSSGGNNTTGSVAGFTQLSTSALSATQANIGDLTVTGSSNFNSGITVSGSTVLSGDLLIGGNATTTGNQYIGGNIVLGNSTSTSLTINSAISSNLVPSVNKTFDIGSPANYWSSAYIDTLNVNNISAASTIISGTASNNFVINSDNSSLDTEPMNLIFSRGIVSPNAVLGWDQVNKRFDLNQPVYVHNATGSTTAVTLEVRGTPGQTADIFRASSSSGVSLFTVAGNGNVGIGTTSPATKLDVWSTTGLSALRINNGDTTLGSGYSQLQFFSSGSQAAINNKNFSVNNVMPAVAGGNNYLSIQSRNDDSTFKANLVTILNNGNVGIGTTSPAANLDVVGKINATNVNGNYIQFSHSGSEGTVTTNFGAFSFQPASGIVYVFKSGVNNELRAYGSGGGQTFVTMKNDNVNSFLGTGATGGNLNLGSQGAYPVTINTSGNVGIGTTSPQFPLHVVNSSSQAAEFDTTSGTFGGTVYAGFGSGRAQIGFDAITNNLILQAVTSKGIAFSTNNSGGFASGNPSMVINSNGNVGIGTTSPTSMLEVGSNTVGGSLAINPTFGAEMSPGFNASKWTLGAGWDSTNGGNIQLNKNATGLGTATPNPALSAIIGTTYKITLTIASSTGNFLLSFGGVSDWMLASTGTGTKTSYFKATNTANLTITPQNTGNLIIITSLSILPLSSGALSVGGNTSIYGSLNLYGVTTGGSQPTIAFIHGADSTNAIVSENESLNFYVSGSIRGGFSTSGLAVNSAPLVFNGNAFLYSDAANALAVRNATNAQTLRVYNTYTDANNYERGTFNWTGNALNIGTENAGTGSSRVLNFLTASTTRLTIDTSGNVGIGTTSPGSKLDVWGNLNVATGSTPSLSVDTNTGRVGVNTTPSASYQFFVDAGASSPNVANFVGNNNASITVGNRSGVSSISLQTQAQGYGRVITSGTSGFAVLVGGGTAPANTASALFANNYTLGLGAFNGATFPSSFPAILDVQSSSTIHSATLDIARFGTSTNPFALLVDHTGNIGIGMSAPAYSLDVTVPSGVSTDLLRVASSTGPAGNGLIVKNNGNVGIGTTSPVSKLNVWGNLTVGTSSTPTLFVDTANNAIGINTTSNPSLGPIVTNTGAYLSAGGTWTNNSDANSKENFTNLNPLDVLNKINTLKITQWDYKVEGPSVIHIGPMAQDFYAQFKVGNSSTSLSTIDPAGVALLGIQALDQKILALQGAISSASSATSSLLAVYSPSSFSGDSVGQAEILAGSTTVRVNFSQDYQYQPIVVISLTGTPLPVFASVSQTDSKGFTVQINFTQTTDLTFNWHSFASPQAQLTVSNGTTSPIILVLGTQPEKQAQTLTVANSSPQPTGNPTQVLGTSTTTPDSSASSTPVAASTTPVSVYQTPTSTPPPAPTVPSSTPPVTPPPAVSTTAPVTETVTPPANSTPPVPVVTPAPQTAAPTPAAAADNPVKILIPNPR